MYLLFDAFVFIFRKGTRTARFLGCQAVVNIFVLCALSPYFVLLSRSKTPFGLP
jgi:hypothetical protein